MQSGRNSAGRQRLAVVAFTSLWLGACGGGGGASDAGAQGAAAAVAAPVASPAGPSADSLPASTASAADPAVAPAPEPAPAPAPSQEPTPTVQGTDGPDTLVASSHPAVLAGGRGDDVYMVSDPADVVIEQSDGGVDEIRTTVGYTLPANVENMSVSSADLVGALVGNALNNRITGAPFTHAEIFGLDGDDILDAGGRYGALLDGGLGNDTLINNVGESRGGPGADTFVVSPRRAMTAPDVPLTVLDFHPDEGDRIDASFLAGGDPAALFASGHLRFDAANQRLIYTRNPGPQDAQPTAVEQIILLPGLASFEPAWIIRR